MNYSVVIPTYNRPEATLLALVSVLGQSLPPHEVLVVDDASTPPFALPAAFMSERIRVLRLGENGGAAAARQAGVDAATGTVLAFLDSDDAWAPDKMARQADTLASAKGGLVAVSCGWRDVARGENRVPLAAADMMAFASGCWFCPGSTLVIERAAFARVGPFDAALRRLEDWEWFLRFGAMGGRLEVTPIIGADIHPSRSARPEQISSAATQILARHAASPTQTRLMRAYLALEQAAAARDVGAPLDVAWHLVRSFAMKPRLQAPLRRWWRGQTR